jgi:hypothetical protein
VEIASYLYVPVTIILLIIALILAAIPVMPGSVLPWLVALAAAVIDGFGQITTHALIVMTIVMVISQLSDFWLPLLGIQTGGMSCLGAVGAFAGGLIGTFAIPIPLVGTLAGSVLGALVVDYLHQRQVGAAIEAGKQAAKLFVVGYAVRIVSSILVVAIAIFSLVLPNF